MSSSDQAQLHVAPQRLAGGRRALRHWARSVGVQERREWEGGGEDAKRCQRVRRVDNGDASAGGGGGMAEAWAAGGRPAASSSGMGGGGAERRLGRAGWLDVSR